MARYVVMGQCFITNGAVITCAEAGRIATAGDTTLNLSTTGGAGTFTITMASATTGTVTSGTATITGSPVTLNAGANTITSNGAGTCTLALTLGTAANWVGAGTGLSWSTTSGGVSGASTPTSADDMLADALSFTRTTQVLTADATSVCKTMDWTGALYSPTLALTNQELWPYGNVTFIAAMAATSTADNSGYLKWYAAGNITCNGLVPVVNIGPFAGLTLQDNLNIGSNRRIFASYSTVGINTNGKTVTCGIFNIGASAGDKATITDSILNCATWTVTNGANTTLVVTNSIINDTGNLTGGGLTYNIFNYTGTGTCVVTGSNTFAQFNGDPAKTQAFTFTDGTTQTAASFSLSGSSGKVHTLQGSSTGGWAITKSGGGQVVGDYISVSRSTGNPDLTWFYGVNGTNGGNNVRWYITQGNFFTAQTKRIIASAATFTGQTKRNISNLASFIGQTLRQITWAASYTAQTKRIVTSAVAFSGQTKRIVHSVASFTAQTLRQVRWLALFTGQTKRVVKSAASFIGQTRRRLAAWKSFPIKLGKRGFTIKTNKRDLGG